MFEGAITQEDVENSLKFQGGGTTGMSPGQITDDSEMALALMRGIIQSDSFDIDQHALVREYVKWYRTSPSDIGQTTLNAMKILEKADAKPGDDQVLKE